MRLSVISGLPESMGWQLKPYEVDGISTVGVLGNEPYEIVFTNTSTRTVQVIISVDGRNVLTGEDAHRDPTADCFVVKPSPFGPGACRLKAWPETSESGGRFVFAHAGDSVAVHTPGDLGSIGYISVAVYVEGHASDLDFDIPVLRGGFETRGGMLSMAPSSFGSGMKSPVGTGVGETVSQHIGKARGLREPTFSEILQVRYLWWDDLCIKLREAGITPDQVHPTGFVPQKLANLGDAPRPAATATPHTGYQRLMPAA